MFDELQTLENPCLRPFLKLDKAVQGIIVHQPLGSDPDYPLKEWDVITRIGDTPVDNEGMIKLGSNLRVQFAYLVQRVARNGKVPLRVVRAGKEMAVELPVAPSRPMVIPGLDGDYPPDFAYGPLTFSEATREYIGQLTGGGAGDNWMKWLSARGSPLTKRTMDKPAFEGERLVVVSSPLFPHKLSKGYSNPIAQVVKSINGQQVKNLKHLVATLRDSKDEFVTVAFDSQAAETIVFPRAEIEAATEEILTDNGVRSQDSAEEMAIWNTKPSR